jgi:hypothetical protein
MFELIMIFLSLPFSYIVYSSSTAFVDDCGFLENTPRISPASDAGIK